jgi:cytoskeleton protein RodZ
MERIGDRLRKRREELGFTVEDIASVIRFRAETIRAIEEGRAGVFPAEAYLKAFLRAYADALGLDADEIVREQKSEEERIRDAIKGIGPHPGRSVNVPKRVVLLVVVAAVAIAAVVVFDRVVSDRYAPGGSVRPGNETVPPAEGRAQRPGPSEPSPDVAGATGADSEAVAPDVTGDSTAGATQPRAESPEPEDTTGRQAETPGPSGSSPEAAGATVTLSKLEVSVSGWPIRARLRSGDSVLVEGWLRPGFADTFYCEGPFVIDYLTDVDAVALTLDGEPVKLPTSKDKRISDFEIPRAR